MVLTRSNERSVTKSTERKVRRDKLEVKSKEEGVDEEKSVGEGDDKNDQDSPENNVPRVNISPSFAPASGKASGISGLPSGMSVSGDAKRSGGQSLAPSISRGTTGLNITSKTRLRPGISFGSPSQPDKKREEKYVDSSEDKSSGGSAEEDENDEENLVEEKNSTKSSAVAKPTAVQGGRRLLPGLSLSTNSKGDGESVRKGATSGNVLKTAENRSVIDVGRSPALSRLPPGMQISSRRTPDNMEENEESSGIEQKHGKQTSVRNSGTGLSISGIPQGLQLTRQTFSEKVSSGDQALDQGEESGDESESSNEEDQDGGEDSGGEKLSLVPVESSGEDKHSNEDLKKKLGKMGNERLDGKDSRTGRSIPGLGISKLPPGMQISKTASSSVTAKTGQEKDLVEEKLDCDTIGREDVRSGSKVQKDLLNVVKIPAGLQGNKSSSTSQTHGDDNEDDLVDGLDEEAEKTDADEEEEEQDQGVKSGGALKQYKLMGKDEGANKSRAGALPSQLSIQEPVDKSSEDEFEDIVEDEESEETVATNGIEEKTIPKEAPIENSGIGSSKAFQELAPLLPLRTNQGAKKKYEQFKTTQLQTLTSTFNLDPALLDRVTKALGQDALRNFTDAVQVSTFSSSQTQT